MKDLPECCRKKDRERNGEQLAALSKRLNRIEGQIRGIKRMLDEGAYCPDIIMQASAASAALASFSRELLADHIKTCVVDGIRAGDDSRIEELTEMLGKMIR